jgi:sulfate permease, SulP family
MTRLARALAICAPRRPDWFGQVSAASLRVDFFAGITGATLVLPQAVAFAAIAGLPPEYGFYTAMVPPVAAALMGSSWHAVSGPTTAISALVFGALAGTLAPGSPEFISAAILLALLVGVVQLALGLARMGALVDFVSHSVMVGFVTGAAILIALSQVGSALSLSLPRPEALGTFAQSVLVALPQTNLHALAVAGIALGAGYGIKRWRPHWPNYLIALMLGTVVSLALGGAEIGIATIGSIGSAVPRPALPEVSLGAVRDLGSAALAIALVGLIEAMSVARAIALKSGQIIDGNREFLGQSFSNIVGSFFQCYPASASFTRSGVNYDTGARTPLSAIFAAGFLFLILQLVAPFFAHVPIPALAGVIILVAWRLIDFRAIRHILTTSSSESAVLAVTFGAALFIDLEFAIYAGVLLSLAIFLKRTSRPFIGIGAPDPSTPNRMFRQASTNNLQECPQLMFARMDGPLYFGSVEFVRRQFRRYEIERPEQKHMIFSVKGVGEIDMAGADLLIEEAHRRCKRGGTFHLQTKTPRTISKLARFKVMKALTKERIHLSKRDAIAESVPLLDPGVCARCRVRIFHECPAAAAPHEDSRSLPEPERAAFDRSESAASTPG